MTVVTLISLPPYVSRLSLIRSGDAEKLVRHYVSLLCDNSNGLGTRCAQGIYKYSQSASTIGSTKCHELLWPRLCGIAGQFRYYTE